MPDKTKYKPDTAGPFWLPRQFEKTIIDEKFHV